MEDRTRVSPCTGKLKEAVEALIDLWDMDRLDKNISNGKTIINTIHNRKYRHEYPNYYSSARIDMQTKVTNRPKYNIQAQIGNNTYACIIIPYDVNIGKDNIKQYFKTSIDRVDKIEC
jgi:hypothetical protein